MWYFLTRHGQEVVEKFEQAHGFVVLLILSCYLKQQRFSVHFEYSKLIQ